MSAPKPLGSSHVRQLARSDEDSAAQPAARSAGLPPLLLNEREAAAVFGISHRAFQTLAAEPFMPRPIVLGVRSLRWSIDELRAAVERMPRQTERAQPEGLLRARIERMKATGAAA